jgi:prepilin-type N-terminal cleavage/methylation domain-containing protein
LNTLSAARNGHSSKRLQRGFSLVEAVVSVAVFSIVASGVFATVTQSVNEIGSMQETLRATQIIEDQMEGVRLYTWDQINTTGFVPTNFVVAYYPTNAGISTTTGSFNYTGKVSIASVPMSEVYSNDHKAVTVTVNWTRENTTHTRSLTTLVSRYGLHNYYYHSY